MIYDIELNSAAHYPADGVVGLVEMAEDAGFGAFWKGESNSTDPIVLLSAVASRTKSIKLGTAIYHIYGRSPVTLGIQSATLQDLSGGRFLLGLGVANKAIAAWHGGVFDRPLVLYPLTCGGVADNFHVFTGPPEGTVEHAPVPRRDGLVRHSQAKKETSPRKVLQGS